MTDTVFALSSAAGVAGVAVIRVSGPGAGAALEALAGCLPVPRQATLAKLRDPDSGETLDQGLILWFPAPASFSGEDMAEFQVHGGRAVVTGLIRSLSERPGLRPAEPGEFTRRAFDNGKLDLTEVEGLADLIAAETEAQRRQALRQMGGALTARSEAWKQRLLGVLAHLEAVIDFPDEDLPPSVQDRIQDQISGLRDELQRYLDDNGSGERLREGLKVVILGPPNAGKSSLLNALAQRDVAIVSETAGTTRDVIEVHLDLQGYPVTLADTAGLRGATLEQDSAIEAEGMRRARDRAGAADLLLAVFDLADWPGLDPQVLEVLDRNALVVLNKSDVRPAPAAQQPMPYETVVVSAKTGAGLPELIARLSDKAAALLERADEAPASTRARHRTAFQDCLAALRRLESAGRPGLQAPELQAEELRLALRALERISGRVDVEDLLDVIFRDFCIGK